MITLNNNPVCLVDGVPQATSAEALGSGREKTITYQILNAHNRSRTPERFEISFDALISHDITYVGIIQTARASGLEEFPLPYALTNCHNSLCAVGGTINGDDHAFGLSAAQKYGGIYVPPNQAVIHQFAREQLCGCGKMILGSDSHTRYGCYGTMGVGEGGSELSKQLLKNTWDITPPEVVLVWLEGKVPHGIGPHDIAIALVGATFPDGKVKNKVLEFAGPGVAGLSLDFRIGIDVMTTETSCLSSIWITDDKVRSYYNNIGRGAEYRELRPLDGACYDSMVTIDLSKMESMIALPFHPSKAYTIHQLQQDPEPILAEIEAACNSELGDNVTLDLHRHLVNGKLTAQQGVIVGCSGGMYENIAEATDILRGGNIGNGLFELSVYPASAPVGLALTKDGLAAELMECGALVKSAFCGPCFGAGDTPANGTLSIRHATRNFANREGSKPANGQIAAVALMDARSIAATALNGGVITAATDIDYDITPHEYHYDNGIYEKRCYFGFGKPQPEQELQLGPNIKDWPVMPRMRDNMLVRLAAVIQDEVTTTDELIPSGETSSYRSNPIGLSEYALSRRVPEYVGRAKAVRELRLRSDSGDTPAEIAVLLDKLGVDAASVSIGSCIYARKPGDGSAREQAASCQKVLGGFANIAAEYATKRYRSNCINWGLIPFLFDGEFGYEVGDWVYIPGVRQAILDGRSEFAARIIHTYGSCEDAALSCGELTPTEREILTEGCLINWYAAHRG